MSFKHIEHACYGLSVLSLMHVLTACFFVVAFAC